MYEFTQCVRFAFAELSMNLQVVKVRLNNVMLFPNLKLNFQVSDVSLSKVT